MKGAAIRAAIVVVAVVVGAVVLAKGFSSRSQNFSGPSSSPSPSATASPSASSSPSPHHSTAARAGRVKGVTLAVFNTTSVVGLAACAAIDLSKHGYVVPASAVLQAPPGTTASATEIFYRNAQGKADAHVLATHFFKNEPTKVRHVQSSADIPKGAELGVFLGMHYASSHQGGC